MDKLDKDKLEILKLVADLAERETDRTWRRTGTMLTVNAGLLVLVTVAIEKKVPVIVLFVGIFGIILSILWHKIAVMSKFYEKRWHKNMEAIIKSDDTLKQWVTGRNDFRPEKRSATGYFRIVIKLTGLFWCALVLYILGWPLLRLMHFLFEKLTRGF